MSNLTSALVTKANFPTYNFFLAVGLGVVCLFLVDKAKDVALLRLLETVKAS